jgi:hypothetical protein
MNIREQRGTILVPAAVTLGLALVLGLIAADPAAAAGDVGTNVGKLVKGWAQALVFPVAALGGLGAYFKRDIGMAFSLLTITVIVGAFAYTPTQVERVINSLWSSLLG